MQQESPRRTFFHSLWLKLILAFLAVSLLGISLVALFARLITAVEFRNYLQAQTQEEIVARLADYYSNHNSWQGVSAELYGVRAQETPDQSHPSPVRNFFVADEQGQVVVHGAGYDEGTTVSPTVLDSGLPIELNGEGIGTLVVSSTSRLDNAQAARASTSYAYRQAQNAKFMRRVNQSLFYGAIGATFVSLILGLFLVRTLIRPVREMTAATRAVAQGDLNQQVPIRSQDELGELAHSFNQMNATLARTQTLRRQMTADIAHELRTPISIILGHAEGLSDGVLPATADTFDIIQDEAERLRRLVEDLRTLSLAEAGELPLHRQSIHPHMLIEQSIVAYTPSALQKNIQLAMESSESLLPVYADPDRILQVLGNLLHNALRYTPLGGRIVLSVQQESRNGASNLEDRQIRFAVRDNGPGIASDELPSVFHRFYRGDKSRQRHDGGSGLGLAIAKSIVEEHNGYIWVESANGDGTTFIFTLPASSSE